VGCTPWSALIGARTQQIDHILSARLKERFECVDLAARFYAELAKLTPTQRWLLVTRASVPPRAATSSRRRFRTTNRERAEGSAILSMNGLGCRPAGSPPMRSLVDVDHHSSLSQTKIALGLGAGTVSSYEELRNDA
jgi:hypothetical protein